MPSGMDFLKMKEHTGLNDAQFVRGVVSKMVFCELSQVTKVANGYVDCMLDGITYTNVEILVPGIGGYAVKVTPKEGDMVLLLCPKSAVADMHLLKVQQNTQAYNIAGLKCIPLATDKATQLVEISTDKLELKGQNKIVLQQSGIKIEDYNGNLFEMKNQEIDIKCTDGSSTKNVKTSIVMNNNGVDINGKLYIKAGS